MSFAVCAALAGATGCPPPPLVLDEPDARDNAPPAILSVRGDDAVEFKLGDPNTLVRGAASMTLELVDTDVEDTLYVRGFLDYSETEFTSARAVCEIGPSTPRNTRRVVACNLAAFCPDVGDHRLDVDVYDREPDDAGALQPPYRNVDEPGLRASRSYAVRCEEPPPL